MKELKNYAITVRITDRQQKPAHLQGAKTDERVSWEDEIEAKRCEDEDQARLAIMMHYSGVYPAKQYKLEIVTVRETLIIPDRKLILPGE